jgi:hypothetical protein
VRFLLRIYPESWRERYGDELEALLDEQPVGPLAAVDLIRGSMDARLHAPGRRVSTSARGSTAVRRDDLRHELQAILAAREELGEGHDQDLVEMFLDHLEEQVVPDGPRRLAIGPQATIGSIVRWSFAAVVLWIVAGISSIAIGFPWSNSSTAWNAVYYDATHSGYLTVLALLLALFCVLSVVWVGQTVVRWPRRLAR